MRCDGSIALESPSLLTGSMASNYWGIPRTTHDLDFVVQLPLNQFRVCSMSFATIFISMSRLCERPWPHRITSAIDRRSALKIDF